MAATTWFAQCPAPPITDSAQTRDSRPAVAAGRRCDDPGSFCRERHRFSCVAFAVGTNAYDWDNLVCAVWFRPLEGAQTADLSKLASSHHSLGFELCSTKAASARGEVSEWPKERDWKSRTC